MMFRRLTLMASLALCFGLGKAHAFQGGTLPSVSDYYAMPYFWDTQGQRVAVPSGSTIEIVNAQSGIVENTFNLESGDVSAVAWSPDGSHIAIGGSNSAIFVWNTETNQLSSSIPAYYNYVQALAWSPNDQRLVVASTDVEVGRLEVWDTSSWTLLANTRRGTYSANSINISSDSQTIAHYGGSFNLINVDDLNVIVSLVLPPEIANYTLEMGVMWNDNDSQVAVSTINGVIFIFDVQTMQLVHTLYGATNAVAGPLLTTESPFTWIRAMRWLPNSNELLTIAGEGTFTRWDTISGQALETGILPALASADFSPYGGRLAVGGTINNGEIDGLSATSPNNFQIIVPSPSPERLQAIAQACDAPPQVVQAITGIAADAGAPDTLSALVQTVEALPATDIPPGCAADLIAVANAIGAQGE